MQKVLIDDLNNKTLFIFDFDGVLADSVQIKMQAFKQMYEPHGEKIVDKVSKYHLLNGGVSRYKKIKYFHKEYLDEEITESELEKLSKEFSSIIVDKVIASNEINGSTKYLKELVKKKKICAINTGTPTKEIKEILKKRNLLIFFKHVYGSPDGKLKNLKNILLDSNLTKEKAVFFGDSSTDLEAAIELNIDFIGVGRAIKGVDTNYKKIKYINDFSELL